MTVALIRALSAEGLKMRRTLALTLAIVTPLVIVFLQVAIVLDRQTVLAASTGEGETVWHTFIRQNMNWWSLLMLPLFATLETALVAGLEHSGDHWKQLFALPIPRGAVYAAKQVAGLGLMALSLLALLAFSVVVGLGLAWARPDVGLDGQIPWGHGLALCGVVFFGAWLVTAIQTWVSLRWKSFVVPCAVGIVATVAGMAVINSDYGPYYPWTLAAVAMLDYVRVGLPMTQLLAGALGGVAVAVVGGWEVTRRDVL